MEKTIIVMPCYNEAETLKKVIDNLKAVGFEHFIVVNDASTDNTYEEAQKMGVTIVNHDINGGLGASLRSGLRKALELEADLVITVDGDGQMRPEDVLKVRDELIHNDDGVWFVVGSRFLGYNKVPFSRRVGNYGLNWITYLLFGIWSSDSQSGLRGFRSDALKEINIVCDRMGVSSQILSECKRNKWLWKEIPITAVYTEHSLEHGQKWHNAFNIVIELIKLRIGGLK